MSLASLLREPPPDHGSCNGKAIRFKPTPKPKAERPHIVISPRVKSHRRQKGVCHYCKKQIHITKWTMDHRIPVSRGGGGGYNLIGCCWTCNHDKGDYTEAEYFALLIERKARNDSASQRGDVARLLNLT